MINMLLSNTLDSSNWFFWITPIFELLKSIWMTFIQPVFCYFSSVFSDLSEGNVVPLILMFLALDTIRTLIAYLGWIRPNTRLGRIIYGRYDQHVMMMALEELGYDPIAQKREVKKWRRLAKQSSTQSGVTSENAAEQLIVLLAKYIVKFPEHGEYGGRTLTTSNYYINTMEISHYPEDAKTMAAIMMQLIRKDDSQLKPQVIITPKGGNPLFANVVSEVLSSHLLLAKASTDKSRANIVGNDPKTRFAINFEGARKILDTSEKKLTCILLDCNTSGGSQLCDILSDIGDILDNCDDTIHLAKPRKAYVLFRADDGKVNIEQKFADRGCKLIRFFDLDEETKGLIYGFKSRCDAERRVPDPYELDDIYEARSILKKIKEKEKCYYKTDSKPEKPKKSNKASFQQGKSIPEAKTDSGTPELGQTTETSENNQQKEQEQVTYDESRVGSR